MYLRSRSLDIVLMMRKGFFFRQVSDQILLVENSDQILLVVENLGKEQLIPHDFTVVAEVPAAASPPTLQDSNFSCFSWKYRFLVFSVFVLLLVDFPEWSCLGLLVSSLLGSSLLKGRKSWWPLLGDMGVVSVISFRLVKYLTQSLSF